LEVPQKERGQKKDIDIAALIDESGLKQKNIERFRKEYYDASPGFSLGLVDIVILNTAPTFLKYQVIKTGKLLFDRNRKLRVGFTERTITEYSISAHPGHLSQSRGKQRRHW
jgi:hypothetical protein